MEIAFYAPLKPLDHPVPSGDRKMARQLVAALRAAGHAVDIACDLRMHATTPHDANLLDQARREADTIIARWERRAGRPADLWFTYHPYYKAPDVVGPIICRHFGIAYVTAEASYAGKRDRDAWQASQAAMWPRHASSLARGLFSTVSIPPTLAVRAAHAGVPRSLQGPTVRPACRSGLERRPH